MRISDWSSDVCSSDLHKSPSFPRRRELRRSEPSARPRACRASARSAPTPARPRDRANGPAPHSRRPPSIRTSRPQAGGSTPHATPCPAHKRSEEHTSELQSLMRISYAVFCLKKKTRYNNNVHTEQHLARKPKLNKPK